MKNKLLKSFLAILIAIGLTSVPTIADAYHCKYVRGYWHHGYYHHGHRLCWGKRPHCVWHNGVKSCYY
jgi:hypothetical protein